MSGISACREEAWTEGQPHGLPSKGQSVPRHKPSWQASVRQDAHWCGNDSKQHRPGGAGPGARVGKPQQSSGTCQAPREPDRAGSGRGLSVWSTVLPSHQPALSDNTPSPLISAAQPWAAQRHEEAGWLHPALAGYHQWLLNTPALHCMETGAWPGRAGLGVLCMGIAWEMLGKWLQGQGPCWKSLSLLWVALILCPSAGVQCKGRRWRAGCAWP